MDNLTNSNEILKSIFGNVPFGIITLDSVGNVTACNHLALQQLQFEQQPSALQGRSFMEMIEHIPELHARLLPCLYGRKRLFDLYALAIGKRFLTVKGRSLASGILITLADITRRRRNENEMMQAVLEAQEVERRRLARDIHDGVGPLLSTLRLQLESLQTKLDPQPDLVEGCSRMLQLLTMITQEVRSISHALMPQVLLDFGLVSALEQLQQKANGTGKINLTFYSTGIDKQLPEPIALGVYRVAQELINNAIKHAGASEVNMQLIGHKDTVILMVEDNGKGIDKHQAGPGIEPGIGLQNIRTRARLLGGAFSLESSPGRGVLATLEIPLNWKTGGYE